VVWQLGKQGTQQPGTPLVKPTGARVECQLLLSRSQAPLDLVMASAAELGTLPAALMPWPSMEMHYVLP
jgi:hypothetical protein